MHDPLVGARVDIESKYWSWHIMFEFQRLKSGTFNPGAT
jgi:hypothetical protein